MCVLYIVFVFIYFVLDKINYLFLLFAFLFLLVVDISLNNRLYLSV